MMVCLMNKSLSVCTEESIPICTVGGQSCFVVMSSALLYNGNRMKTSAHDRGFTLIELMVVVSIIGTLATIIVTSLNEARDRAQRANALTELSTLRDAFFALELDTNVMPGGQPVGTCAANDEYSTNPASPDCGAGLICNTARLYPSGATYTYPSSWAGPYVSEAALTDPWGNYYLFDYDVHCGSGANEIPSEKCGGNSGEVVGVTTGGPDGDFFTYTDNEVVVVCAP